MNMALVFQYGSNATNRRLNGPGRLNGHTTDRGRACTVVGFHFHSANTTVVRSTIDVLDHTPDPKTLPKGSNRYAGKQVHSRAQDRSVMRTTAPGLEAAHQV